MYELLGNNHVVKPHSSKDKCSLERGYEVGKQGSSPHHNYFSDYLIYGITQTNGSKGTKTVNSLTLR